MNDDAQVHHRRSIRWHGYDYSQPGCYFFTICTADKRALFGRVSEGQMFPSGAGMIVTAAWNDLAQRYEGIEVDAFVVMPNHVHGIIRITDGGAASSAPTRPLRRATLGEILRAFKSVSAHRVNQLSGRNGSLWQRNYYERVLRPGELDKVRQYIETNPLRWGSDIENRARADSDAETLML